MSRGTKIGVAVAAAALCVAVLAVIVVRSKLRLYNMPSSAMRPTIEAGDRFVVDKWAYARRGPERWDVIVFRYPVDPSRDYIKRVVGLPGEQVHIRGGDLFINGSMARKPWHVQEALWRPLSGSGKAEAWRADDPKAWRIAQGLFEVDCSSKQDPEFLSLRQEIHAYDPGLLRSAGVPVPPPTTCDVMVEFLVEPRAEGGAVLVAFVTELTMGITRPVDRWLVQLPLTEGREAPEVYRSGSPAAHGQACNFAVGTAVPVQACHVDQTLVVRVAGREVVRHEYQLPDVPGHPGLPSRTVQITLGCKGGHVVFRRPSVSVDLYFTDYPYKYAIYEPFTLGEDEYFTVGDNNINSNDSRSWGAVSRDAIVGKATRIVSPSGREGPIR